MKFLRLGLDRRWTLLDNALAVNRAFTANTTTHHTLTVLHSAQRPRCTALTRNPTLLSLVYRPAVVTSKHSTHNCYCRPASPLRSCSTVLVPGRQIFQPRLRAAPPLIHHSVTVRLHQHGKHRTVCRQCQKPVSRHMSSSNCTLPSTLTSSSVARRSRPLLPSQRPQMKV
jgi:hypothetical protein